MSEKQQFQLGTIGALCLSVVSSVSIVICNKALISTLRFTFATTLTSWHLLVTFCSLHVALWLKMFERKPFDPRAVMGFGILNGISIGLLNLSLGFNSVGFYQMTKLAIIPCTVLLETLFFMKKFRGKAAATSVPVFKVDDIILAGDYLRIGQRQMYPGITSSLPQLQSNEK
ncbi:hypothetical protein Cgig2_011281 [Carnegiea gigantea]|uniref:Uncharacterized protein n=1 Tax=Carnegiea gigantea TaxID=171969 RepID=A0A9Q1JK36_9CARY|nr:hypothetical protein Cgig2_011281 [Carnegiea gigantea]